MPARLKPPMSWAEVQALSKIVNRDGAPATALALKISTTTLGRWLAKIAGPVGDEQDRLDALLGRKPAGRRA